MKFGKRLRAYLIGVGLGMLMVFVFFGERLSIFSSWFPQNRVKMSIYEGQWQHSDDDIASFAHCLGYADTVGFKQHLMDSLQVDFATSKVQQEPKLYMLLYGADKRKLNVSIAGDTLIKFESLTEICP